MIMMNLKCERASESAGVREPRGEPSWTCNRTSEKERRKATATAAARNLAARPTRMPRLPSPRLGGSRLRCAFVAVSRAFGLRALGGVGMVCVRPKITLLAAVSSVRQGLSRVSSPPRHFTPLAAPWPRAHEIPVPLVRTQRNANPRRAATKTTSTTTFALESASISAALLSFASCRLQFSSRQPKPTIHYSPPDTDS